MQSITAEFRGDGQTDVTASQSTSIRVLNPTIVDVMVVYTGEGDHPWSIQNALDGTNEALNNSHIPLSVRLVHAEHVDYEESRNLELDLYAITDQGDGQLDQLSSLRGPVPAPMSWHSGSTTPAVI